MGEISSNAAAAVPKPESVSPITVAWTQPSPFLPFTEPDDISYLRKRGIIYARTVLAADVLLSLSASGKRFRLLRKLLFWKPALVWTNEPRFDVSQPGEWKEPRLRVMNVFSGDVFWHNLHFLGAYHGRHQVDLGIDLARTRPPELTIADLERRKSFCISVFGWRDPQVSSFLVQDRDIDLNARRQALALRLFERKRGDIVGSGWPREARVIEQSGFEKANSHWWLRKLELIANYRFNVCFENTAWPYYCTEKIWHAIAAGCLPINWGGGTRIYETFPPNSFVDASHFATDDALIDYLEAMTPGQHLVRYQLCREVFLTACAERLTLPRWREEIIQKFADGIRSLI